MLEKTVETVYFRHIERRGGGTRGQRPALGKEVLNWNSVAEGAKRSCERACTRNGKGMTGQTKKRDSSLSMSGREVTSAIKGAGGAKAVDGGGREKGGPC